ncbi:hypothetical protein FQ087_14485 [Sporosarcina sp. ANT_H38]|nr:hypothetical protein FQ087_14485 [Sporosarcina sp. ANT_H38]
MQFQTILKRLVNLASKLVESGRSLHFKLSSSFIFQQFFWKIFIRIQPLKIE